MMTERLLWPLTRLGTTVDDYERAKASARRAFGLLGHRAGDPGPGESGAARRGRAAR